MTAFAFFSSTLKRTAEPLLRRAMGDLESDLEDDECLDVKPKFKRIQKIGFSAPFGSSEKKFFMSPWMKGCLSELARHDDFCGSTCTACNVGPTRYRPPQYDAYFDLERGCARDLPTGKTFVKAPRDHTWRFDGTTWKEAARMGKAEVTDRLLKEDAQAWLNVNNGVSASIHNRELRGEPPPYAPATEGAARRPLELPLKPCRVYPPDPRSNPNPGNALFRRGQSAPLAALPSRQSDRSVCHGDGCQWAAEALS